MMMVVTVMAVDLHLHTSYKLGVVLVKVFLRELLRVPPEAALTEI
jgi:hypothetical protein